MLTKKIERKKTKEEKEKKIIKRISIIFDI
jgi:hypothetical protein